MESGTANVPSEFFLRRWESSVRLPDRFLGPNKSDLAVGAVAEWLYHRASAATERDPAFALRCDLTLALWDGNRISFVIDEANVAVYPVRTILANLDRDVCH
jgi:hypothetical protein